MASGAKKADEATTELAAKQPSQHKSTTSIYISCGTFQDLDQQEELDPYIIHHPHNLQRSKITTTPKSPTKEAGPTGAAEKEEP